MCAGALAFDHPMDIPDKRPAVAHWGFTATARLQTHMFVAAHQAIWQSMAGSGLAGFAEAELHTLRRNCFPSVHYGAPSLGTSAGSQ